MFNSKAENVHFEWRKAKSWFCVERKFFAAASSEWHKTQQQQQQQQYNGSRNLNKKADQLFNIPSTEHIER